MGGYTRQINYTGQDHIDKTYYEKKKGEVVTSTLWNTVLGALVTRSNAYDIALQQTAAFESNFLLFQQEYRKFTQDFEVFKSSRAQFESDTISRFRGLESAIDGLRVRQNVLETNTTSRFIDLESFVSELETADDAIRSALTVFDIDINTLKSDVDQRMTRSEVRDYVADELSKIELVEVVTELPEKGETNKLYLFPVPVEDNDGQDDIFFEYVWADNTWERLGTKQIKINLDGYVKNTDYATKTTAGVVKAGNGLYAHTNGSLEIDKANQNEIAQKALHYKPITPVYVDYAVKVGMTTNQEKWTEEDKSAARELIGAMKAPEKNSVGYNIVPAVMSDGTHSNILVSTNPRSSALAQYRSGGQLTTNTPTEDTHATPKAYVDNKLEAIAIQNTVSGGKTLTVNDVSPLAHKCSLKLISDTYKFNSENIFVNLGDYEQEITYTIDEKGVISYEGEGCPSGFTIIFELKDLEVGESYTFISDKNSWVNGYNIHYENGNIDDNFGIYVGDTYTFTRTEDVSYYEIECVVDISSYNGGAFSGTFTPKLDFATEIDFSIVKVYVNDKSYTPTADGTVTDIASVSPTMEITTDNPNVNIVDFSYCVDTKAYVDNLVGDVETALDKLHAYAQSLINGGVEQ